jgi:hypothetical protein
MHGNTLPLGICPEKGLSMDGMYELFRNKPQEIISMKVYYELGEMDFAQLEDLAENCPKFQAIIEQSYRVGEPKKSGYFLVPVEMVLEACRA